MDLALWVYAAEALSVAEGGEAIGFFSLVIAIIYKCFAVSEKYRQLWPNVALTCGLVLAMWAFLVPDRQGMYTIMAAYGVDQVTQSEDVQRVASKSLAVFEKRMDEYLGEQDESP